jgi:exopolysaccharide biosynthesis polyprenyl glycosylphosphotransferase
MLQISYRGLVTTELWWAHVVPFSFLFLVWLILFYVLDFYDLTASFFDATFWGRLVIALVSFFLSGVTFFYLFVLTDITPKTNLLIVIILFGICASFWRVFFLKIISHMTPLRIWIYGADVQDELHQVIQSHQPYGFASVINADPDNDFSTTLSSHRIHAVVLPEGAFLDPTIIQAFYKSLHLGVRFFDRAQAHELFARRIPLSVIDHTWFIRHIHEREHGFYLFCKRIFDIFFSFAFMIVTSPLWFLIMFAIKIDETCGTIFYSQKRVGKSGRVFDIFKFRTMTKDAEKFGVQWAQKNDPRVTRVGKFLRFTHLDELPQLINVLRGDLSLVGPRPERPEFVDRLEQEIPHFHVRHFIQPGVTGWAQIRYRKTNNILDARTKLEYDLYYIKNRSLPLDFLILLKTAQFFFRSGE